jgi:hypothetical protein
VDNTLARFPCRVSIESVLASAFECAPLPLAGHTLERKRMELEKQVTSVELSNKLKDLGVQTPSLFIREWRGAKEEEIEIQSEPSYYIEGVNCYTVAELGERLPTNENIVTMHFSDGNAQIAIQGDVELEEGLATHWGAASKCIEAGIEADARAKMLIYFLENKLMELTRVQ